MMTEKELREEALAELGCIVIPAIVALVLGLVCMLVRAVVS